MSSHSLKSKRRHTDPARFERERFVVAHVTFEIADKLHLPENQRLGDASTFALIAGEAIEAKDRRPLFSGFVTPDMADELRALAKRLDPICFDLRKAASEREEGVS